MAIVKRENAKPVAPILGTVFCVIYEGTVGGVSYTPGVYTVSCTIVIGERSYLSTVEVPGYNRAATSDSVIMRRVYTALESVFNDDFIIDED